MSPQSMHTPVRELAAADLYAESMPCVCARADMRGGEELSSNTHTHTHIHTETHRNREKERQNDIDLVVVDLRGHSSRKQRDRETQRHRPGSSRS
jgi:hypothetical protein